MSDNDNIWAFNFPGVEDNINISEILIADLMILDFL